MTDRMKLVLFAASTVLLVLLVMMRLLNAPAPQRMPLKFKTGPKSAVPPGPGLPMRQPAPSSADGRLASLPFMTPKNIFAPLDASGSRHALASASRPSPKAVRAPGRRRAPPPAERAGGVVVDATAEADAAPSALAEAPMPAGAVEDTSTAGRPEEVAGPPSPPEAERAAKHAYRLRQIAAEEALRQHELFEQQVREQQEKAAQLAKQQKEHALQQAKQLMGQYRFLGFLTQGGEHRAFLAKGTELYIVSTGEMVEGRLKITAIDAASVKLHDPGTSLDATLLLVKDAKEAF